ncbi:MAG: cytochrome c oxidase subunit II [Gemmataceae bacterium]|nr:cytochrome c oxidase subunit II [Gemmataceae bacterium]MDW8264951.1 cytochrome c oxidase subunit II [Gemmataceae bacterium]
MSLFLPLAVSGLNRGVSVFHPASPATESIRHLFILVLAISGAIFLVVEGVLCYSILRFRCRSSDPGTEPPQVYGSKPVEIAWTAAPALVVFILVLVLARTEYEVRVRPPKPQPGDEALFVTVVGRQWWWEYRYEYFNGEALGFVTANELHIPVGDAERARPVYLTLVSADVCHSFWVPRLAGKTDLIPGRQNSMWLQTTEAGLYLGQCAEYCGTQHAYMLLRVYAEQPSDFRRWLENQRKPAVNDPSVQTGRQTFLGLSCVNCHRIRGTSAAGSYGPDLTHLMSRATLAAGVVPNDRLQLRRWVADPQQIKAGCLMPSFGLSEGQVGAIVDYFLTLR